MTPEIPRVTLRPEAPRPPARRHNGAVAPTGPPRRVDYATVRRLRDDVSAELSRLLSGRVVDDETRQLHGERLAAQHVRT